MDLKAKINDYIHKNKNKAIELLQNLVREKSVSGNEAAAQKIVSNYLQNLELVIDRFEPSIEELTKSSYFISERTSFEDSPNIVAIFKGTGNGRSIILNGHIDVVPKGELSSWERHPYSGAIVGNRLYGRGTTDMKGGNVAALFAIEAIKKCNIPLKGDIYFESVIEEESGGAGTLATILRGYEADAVLIPEPTKMKIFPKQQGSVWFRIKVKGKVAHGGTRYEGISAIEKSILVINHINQLEKVRNTRLLDDPLYKNVPIPIPINIGKINGGTWPSSVSDLVTLEGRLGVSPNETIEEAKLEITRWLKTLSLIDDWFIENPVELEFFGARWLPGSIDLEHPFMESLKKSYEYVYKNEPIIEASPWGTDGGLFSQIKQIPTIVFGPGETKVAHYPNEYIDLDELFRCAEVIAYTLLDWCGVDE
ncbi:acetylornithine deacetylase [Bacillus sp. AFS077874]|uniref:peptidase n=1 Tax=unclassified Bacillus (in: firmicutes) TaxID=185979 RepID=UPI000BED9013|nr:MULTISPECIES: peptidase [unclassified Bacillus (in: firmicutes)]PEC50777.1 acetylornithine deacetylase [Bacillus sp. AFS096315]PFM80035.1 acetylornithine deacetylase [Bacillus sp. AFS077874]